MARDKYAKTKRAKARRAKVKPRATKAQVAAEAKRIIAAAPAAKAASLRKSNVQKFLAQKRADPSAVSRESGFSRTAASQRRKKR